MPLHLGWKGGPVGERMGKMPISRQKTGEMPGHMGGLCGPHLERAGQAFAESGDRGDGNVILIIPPALDLPHDITHMLLASQPCFPVKASFAQPGLNKELLMAPVLREWTQRAGWIPCQLSVAAQRNAGI